VTIAQKALAVLACAVLSLTGGVAVVHYTTFYIAETGMAPDATPEQRERAIAVMTYGRDYTMVEAPGGGYYYAVPRIEAESR
jgi:hypothetical protein